MNALRITCTSCGRSWPLEEPHSVYLELVLESQPHPACEAYALSCPEPDVANRLRHRRGHGEATGLQIWPRQGPTPDRDQNPSP
jgi:hypothetical protein